MKTAKFFFRGGFRDGQIAVADAERLAGGYMYLTDGARPGARYRDYPPDSIEALTARMPGHLMPLWREAVSAAPLVLGGRGAGGHEALAAIVFASFVTLMGDANISLRADDVITLFSSPAAHIYEVASAREIGGELLVELRFVSEEGPGAAADRRAGG